MSNDVWVQVPFAAPKNRNPNGIPVFWCHRWYAKSYSKRPQSLKNIGSAEFTKIFNAQKPERFEPCTRLKLFEPTEAVVHAEGRRKASFNAYIGVTSPICRTTASQAPYRLRRFLHALHLKSPLHSLRCSAFSPQSCALRGPLLVLGHWDSCFLVLLSLPLPSALSSLFKYVTESDTLKF